MQGDFEILGANSGPLRNFKVAMQGDFEILVAGKVWKSGMVIQIVLLKLARPDQKLHGLVEGKSKTWPDPTKNCIGWYREKAKPGLE